RPVRSAGERYDAVAEPSGGGAVRTREAAEHLVERAVLLDDEHDVLDGPPRVEPGRVDVRRVREARGVAVDHRERRHRRQQRDAGDEWPGSRARGGTHGGSVPALRRLLRADAAAAAASAATEIADPTRP